LFSGLGGTLEHFYFAFAPENLVVICDLPDNEAAAAFSLASNSSGAAGGHVTALLSPEDGPRDHQVAGLPGTRRVSLSSGGPDRPVVSQRVRGFLV
jgi:GYD domain